MGDEVPFANAQNAVICGVIDLDENPTDAVTAATGKTTPLPTLLSGEYVATKAKGLELEIAYCRDVEAYWATLETAAAR